MVNDRSEVQARRFYSQRNMYLCGFTLFLTLILLRTYSLVTELLATKDKVDVLSGSMSENGTDDSKAIMKLKSELAEKEQELLALKETGTVEDEGEEKIEKKEVDGDDDTKLRARKV